MKPILLTDKTPEPITRHAQMAKDCGLNPNILTASQRRGSVPKNVSKFNTADILFLQKLAHIVENMGLIQLQLRLFSDERTNVLLAEPAGNENFKRWERRAIDLMIKYYDEVPAAGEKKDPIDTAVILDQVRATHSVLDIKKNVLRMQVLRKIAYDRVFALNK
jgi:hypothetical protein